MGAFLLHILKYMGAPLSEGYLCGIKLAGDPFKVGTSSLLIPPTEFDPNNQRRTGCHLVLNEISGDWQIIQR